MAEYHNVIGTFFDYLQVEQVPLEHDPQPDPEPEWKDDSPRLAEDTPKVERILPTSVPEQCLQRIPAFPDRTSTSNDSPHRLHMYSKMGITSHLHLVLYANKFIYTISL